MADQNSTAGGISQSIHDVANAGRDMSSRISTVSQTTEVTAVQLQSSQFDVTEIEQMADDLLATIRRLTG